MSINFSPVSPNERPQKLLSSEPEDKNLTQKKNLITKLCDALINCATKCGQYITKSSAERNIIKINESLSKVDQEISKAFHIQISTKDDYDQLLKAIKVSKEQLVQSRGIVIKTNKAELGTVRTILNNEIERLDKLSTEVNEMKEWLVEGKEPPPLKREKINKKERHSSTEPTPELNIHTQEKSQETPETPKTTEVVKDQNDEEFRKLEKIHLNDEIEELQIKKDTLKEELTNLSKKIESLKNDNSEMTSQERIQNIINEMMTLDDQITEKMKELEKYQ